MLTLHYEDGKIVTEEIAIRNGIFQGDSLSPLLFCMGLFPLSRILNRSKLGVKVKEVQISHTFYIDDLKVFARNAEELNRIQTLVSTFSKDIGMSFGLDKCAVLTIVQGQIFTSPLNKEFPNMSESERYKYLGMQEGTTLTKRTVLEGANKVYLQ